MHKKAQEMNKDNQVKIVFTVSGPDQPGITSTLFESIVNENCSIQDMGQEVTHGLLSLSFVIKTNDKDAITKELLFKTNQLKMNLSYEVLEEGQNTTKNIEKFILSCISTKTLPASFIADLSKTLASNNINISRINNMAPDHFKSLEITTGIPTSVEWPKVKSELIKISDLHSVDMAFIKDNVFRRSKRLIVFDMDSTLIQAEVINELAKANGAGEKVQAITEEAMNGELDFTESLERRVSELEGLSTDKMQTILKELPLTPGVEEFVRTVKNLGYKIAVISGGFSFFADALKEKLDLDYAFANQLEVIDNKVTGKITGTIVDAEQKAILLKLIAQQEKISLEQVVAIGDGANDLPMLASAGLGIAFHAKRVVKEKATSHMSHGPMTSILHFLGIPV